MLNRMTLSLVAGILSICLGLVVMYGWYAHITALITILPGYKNIVFNSALGFFLAGIALLVPGSKPTLQKNVFFVVGLLLTILSVATLIQNIAGVSFGIDDFFVTSWLIDQNPHPGRMGDNSSLAFLFSGLSLILLPFTHRKTAAAFAQVFIFSSLILGFSALTGYLVHMENLYNWTSHAYMSLQTSIGNTIVGLGLWSVWNKKVNYEELSPEKEEKRIFSLTATIMFCVALLSGAIVLRVFPRLDEGFFAIHNEVEPAILIAALVGMSVLLWQLFPFIKQILRSEKKLISANALIKESENRFRSAFDHAAIGMALISIQGKFIRVNQSLGDILGYTEKELLIVNTDQIMHMDDLKNNKKVISDMLDGLTKIYKAEQRYYHKSGEIVWVSVSMSLVCDTKNEPLYFISQLQNITAEKKAEARLRHLAYHDTLTGLFNRNSLEQKMQEVLSHARRNETGFSVIFLDLDRFKNINDTIGHDAGDMLLQIVSQRLKNTVRTTDAIARVGGDEFVILLTELNKVDLITNIVRKIIANLQQRIVIKGHEIYTTTSIGVSVYPYDGTDVQILMKNSDLALYRAKELGRNNYQFCTPEMTAKAQQKMARQNAIIQAMVKNEFELFYQPKLDLTSQTISGVEALLRWNNAEYSNINASEIIHLAEETGFIIALNEWVLKTACEQVAAWHEIGFSRLSLSVNMSVRQFKQANFIESLMNMLEKTEYPADCLELEITETLIMQDPEYILVTLHQLKEKGICIAIDDFGTGYSSLDYLRRFSVDKIKIDRKFIQTISTDSASTSIVSAMIAMANKLGIDTVAEGVETREQYEFLLREKCTEMQGYYLSPPMDADSMIKFLQNPMMQSFLMRTSENGGA